MTIQFKTHPLQQEIREINERKPVENNQIQNQNYGSKKRHRLPNDDLRQQAIGIKYLIERYRLLKK